MPSLPPFIQAWSSLLIALAPLLPQLIQMGADILPILADILVRTAPITIGLLNALTALANFIVPILVPALKLWENTARDGWNTIKGTFDGMKSGVKDLWTQFEKFINLIRGAWDGLVGAISKPFKDLGNVGKVFGSITRGLTGNAGGGTVPGRAGGGVIDGPGTGTSDSILGIGADGIPTSRVSAGEYVSDAETTRKFLPLLQALPGFAEGGIVDSMTSGVHARFPDMQMTSGLRPGDPGWRMTASPSR